MSVPFKKLFVVGCALKFCIPLRRPIFEILSTSRTKFETSLQNGLFLHRRPASTSRMACSMASHACLARPQPLPLLRRVTLLLSSTPIAQTGTISMIDSLSPHLIGGLLELCIQAGEKAHGGPESRYVHRSLTQIHAASIRGPCRHVRRKNAAARRSVLPTSRGRAFESQAR